MAIMLGKLYEALLHRDDAQLAREAAEEVAGYRPLTDLRRDLTVIRWLVWMQFVLTLGLLWLLLQISDRIGAA